MEKFLCVGGTEIANPSRTEAYFRSMGHPMLRQFLSGACCDFGGDPSARITREYRVCTTMDCTDEDLAVAHFTISITRDGDPIDFSMAQFGQVLFPAPAGWPAGYTVPANDDPGWVANPTVSPHLALPFGDYTPLVELVRVEFNDPDFGPIMTMWVGFTGVIGLNNSGGAAVSYGGSDWHPFGIIPTDPPNTAELCITMPRDMPQEVAWGSIKATANEDGWRYNFDAGGGIGPWEISGSRWFELPAAPLDLPCVGYIQIPLPEPGDPGWVDTSGAPVWFGGLPAALPRVVTTGALDPPVPAGWYEVTFHDIGADRYYPAYGWFDGCIAAHSWADGEYAMGVPDFGPITGYWPATGLEANGTHVQYPSGRGALSLEARPAYSNPADDDAPWYDPARPESGDVIGVWIEDMVPGQAYKRTMAPRQFGGTLGSTQIGPRELHITGWVYTRSKAASVYMRNWLLRALSGGFCHNNCDEPDAVFYLACGCGIEDTDRYRRTLKRVGLMGENYNPNLEPTFPLEAGFKFEATLNAEIGYLYGQSFTSYDGPVVDLDTDPVCAICDDGDPEPLPFGCGTDLPVRVVPPPPSPGAYCTPVEVRRFYTPVSAPQLWADMAGIITVRAGIEVDAGPSQPGLRNLRILGYQNPLGLTTPFLEGIDYLAGVKPCMSIEVSCLPPSAELVIDGTTRRAYVRWGGRIINGYEFLSSNGGGVFAWPEASCEGLMLCVETDATPGHTAPDTNLRCEWVSRELGA